MRGGQLPNWTLPLIGAALGMAVAFICTALNSWPLTAETVLPGLALRVLGGSMEWGARRIGLRPPPDP